VTIGRWRLPSYTLRPNLIRPRQVLSPLFRSFCILGFCETPSLLFSLLQDSSSLSTMSRFTSAYHTNRPSPHQPTERQPLTSVAVPNPNTANLSYPDDLAFSTNTSGNSHMFGDPHELPPFSGLPSLAAFSDTPTRMPSRTTTSVLGYNQSGRERSRRRASRWLVLVLPPSFIAESQGALGHTLSSGPSSRLSQGLLLPLYPTVNQPLLQLSEPRILPTCLISIKTFRCMRSWARSPVNSISQAPRGFACICTSTKPVPCSHRG